MISSLDNDVKAFIRLYSEGHTNITELLTASREDNAELNRQVIGSESRIIDHVISEGSGIKDHLTDKFEDERLRMSAEVERARYLASLRFGEMNKRQGELTEPEEDTVKWLFEETETSAGYNLLTWLQSGNGLFWVSGKPGSGKSTLMNYMVGHQSTIEALEKWRSPVLLLKYYFVEAGTIMQRNLKGCLCSLLHQFLEQQPSTPEHLCHHLRPHYNKKNVHDWSSQLLQKGFLDYLEGNENQAICIFLDGLDEVDPDEQSLVVDLVNRLEKLPHAKLCISSRPENIFRRSFSHHAMLKVQDLTRPGIAAYTRSNIQPILDQYPKDATRMQYIVESLVYGAEGVFLWIVLVAKSLERGRNDGDDWDTMRKRIDHLPRGLYDMYQQMCASITEDEPALVEQYRKEAAELFWSASIAHGFLQDHQLMSILMANHPMLRDRLLALYSSTQRLDHSREESNIFHHFESWLCSRSANLIELDWDVSGRPERGARFRFVHRSVKEFLYTAAGQDIMSFDQRSDEHKWLNLAEATLATHAFCDLVPESIFNSERFDFCAAVGWDNWFNLRRGTIPPVPALAVECITRFNLRKDQEYDLIALYNTYLNYPGSTWYSQLPHHHHLRLAAQCGSRAYLQQCMKEESIEVKSEVLLWAVRVFDGKFLYEFKITPFTSEVSFWEGAWERHLNTITWLLDSGADPNMSFVCAPWQCYKDMFHLNKLTPWVQLLSQIIECHNQTNSVSLKTIALCRQCIQAFILHKADKQAQQGVSICIDQNCSWFDIDTWLLVFNASVSAGENVLFVAVDAEELLKILNISALRITKSLRIHLLEDEALPNVDILIVTRGYQARLVCQKLTKTSNALYTHTVRQFVAFLTSDPRTEDLEPWKDDVTTAIQALHGSGHDVQYVAAMEGEHDTYIRNKCPEWTWGLTDSCT